LLGHLICDPQEEAPPPPPAAPPPPPPPPPPAKGTKLATVGEAYFDFDKAELKPSAEDVLRETVKTLKDNPDLHVVVEGHTDSIGSDQYNLRLSEKRAEAVKRYLVRQGVDPSRITTRGYGESRPIADNTSREGRAKNRRAEIVVD
jgi:OOP family OmpA-OmpF porin